MKQEVLELALEAFWAKIAEKHPERESGNLDPRIVHDLGRWAQQAYEVWLEMNKPVYYVQRTLVQVIKVVDASTPEEAEGIAADFTDAEYRIDAIDTSVEYITLDRNGKQCC